LVTLVVLPVEGVEHESIRTQFLRSNAIVTLVELVALLWILKLAVLLLAVEYSTWK
jgi:hypothetical protein